MKHEIQDKNTVRMIKMISAYVNMLTAFIGTLFLVLVNVFITNMGPLGISFIIVLFGIFIFEYRRFSKLKENKE